MPRRNETEPAGAGPRTGRGAGACGGTPRRNGSGGGTGNRGTNRQPPKKSR